MSTLNSFSNYLQQKMGWRFAYFPNHVNLDCKRSISILKNPEIMTLDEVKSVADALTKIHAPDKYFAIDLINEFHCGYSVITVGETEELKLEKEFEINGAMAGLC